MTDTDNEDFDDGDDNIDGDSVDERHFITDDLDVGVRLDKYLAGQCPDLSRTRLQDLIQDGQITVDGKNILPSLKLKSGMAVAVLIPPPVDDTPRAENIPLNVVFEDEHLLVINKPAGLVVHPAAGHADGTLVNALLYHCGDSLSGIGGVRRPGIVHRLDKDTSGLMLVAKNDRAHKHLSAQLADRSLSRTYTAFVWDAPFPKSGVVDAPIGRHAHNRQKMAINRTQSGRDARTKYTLIDSYGGGMAAQVQCDLETGRTHQVRVHMAHLGHPLVGDPLYGLQRTGRESRLRKGHWPEDTAETINHFPRQALHAARIRFIHPADDTEKSFEAPLPDDMAALLNALKSAP